MTIYLKSSRGFAIAQLLLLHGFHDQLLEFRRVSFVRYSFWHRKTPHLLDSISYCLTNGVLFTPVPRFFMLLFRLQAPQQGVSHAATLSGDIEALLIDAPLKERAPMQHHQLLHDLVGIA